MVLFELQQIFITLSCSSWFDFRYVFTCDRRAL